MRSGSGPPVMPRLSRSRKENGFENIRVYSTLTGIVDASKGTSDGKRLMKSLGLEREFADQVRKMQTRESKRGAKALFATSTQRLGKAAVEAAKSRNR